MNWLNIHTDTLRSEEYLGAEPVERATWLNLMAWCVSQENGGVIEGADTWGERKWMQVCGITKQEATLVSKLFKIGSDGSMIVSLYPTDKEDEVKTKREVARENGKKGGRPPKEPTSVIEETNVGTNEEPTLQSGREREGKENGKESIPLPGDALELDDSPKENPSSFKSRVAAIYGRRESTKWSAKELKALKDAGKPDEEDIALLESYYAAKEDTGVKLYRRKQLLTLLNNLPGEIDNARMWAETNKPSKSPQIKTGAWR